MHQLDAIPETAERQARLVERSRVAVTPDQPGCAALEQRACVPTHPDRAIDEDASPRGLEMLEHLGQPEAAQAIVRAIETVLADGPRTPDMGGTAHTEDVGRAIAEAL